MEANIPPRTHRSDTYLLYSARWLRGFGDGFAVVILPAYMISIALSPCRSASSQRCRCSEPRF
jgi:hypothetical protein